MRRLRRGALLALAVGLAVGLAFGLQYRRQIISYLTHLKGSPTHTEPYVPFPAGDPPTLRVAVAGDIGDSGDRLDRTGDAIARLGEDDPYDVLLLLGDNVYPAGDPAGLPGTVFAPFARVLDGGAALLAILGNHDVMEGHGADQMEALGMPGRWWSYERDGVLFIGLDSNRTDDPGQRAWLEKTLGSSTATWRIVAVHHPPYSAGYQGSNEEVRAQFGPLFERHDVQLVLSGHDHDYQRSKRINGVTYVVSGAAAGTRRTGEEGFTAVSFSWHHFLDLGIYPDRIIGRAVNQDGRVADEWVLT
ncbi:MAG TPA: metallophosphoesterase [Acidimicrobiia bacterium]